MLHSIVALSCSLVRWFVRHITSSHKYLALWVVCRCLPERPVYKLLVYAYAVSAVVQLLSFIAICGGLVLFTVSNYSNGFVVFSLLAAVVAVRFRFGSPMVAALLGGLTLLPNPNVNWVVIQLPLSLCTWLAGLAVFLEQQIRRRQFHFKPFYMSNINEGSAKILRDEVHVVHLFVDTTLKWSVDDRKAVRSIAAEALAWLTAQAKRYKVPLRFNERELWQCEHWQQEIPESLTETKGHQAFGNWLNHILEGHLSGFAADENTNSCLLVYVKEELSASWAYAVPKHRLRNQACQLEYAVIGAPHAASAIAHELLHLFGADDFYLAAYWGCNYDEPQSRSKLLDKCIMFITKSTISSSLVDDLTAQSIGWL